jgi:hypothetical protein
VRGAVLEPDELTVAIYDDENPDQPFAVRWQLDFHPDAALLSQEDADEVRALVRPRQ